MSSGNRFGEAFPDEWKRKAMVVRALEANGNDAHKAASTLYKWRRELIEKDYEVEAREVLRELEETKRARGAAQQKEARPSQIPISVAPPITVSPGPRKAVTPSEVVYPALPERSGREEGEESILRLMQDGVKEKQVATARWDLIVEEQKGMAKMFLHDGRDLRMPRIRELPYYFQRMGAFKEVLEVLYEEHKDGDTSKRLGELETDASLRRKFGADKIRLIEDFSNRPRLKRA